MATTDKYTTSNALTTVPDWETLPCVRYGFPPGSKHDRQAPTLKTIFEPTPKEATTASPVYLLTQDEYKNQHAEWRKSPYQVKDYTSIAKKLQDDCTGADRVLYPIHIESDELRNVGGATLMEWFREFVEEYLNAPFDTCTLYFSGNRSIHVHVPRFLRGKHQQKQLKNIAEKFCEETGAKLDCSIYSIDQQFRLPKVEHEKTGMPKLELHDGWNDAEMSHRIRTAVPEFPDSYEEILRHVFLDRPLVKDTAELEAYTPHNLFHVLDSNKTTLDLLPSQRDIETPLIEQKECPEDSAEVFEWYQYNATEFSPYALATGNSRSVAVVKVKGTPFARRDIRIGNGGSPINALVPSYFYGARGCKGGEFTKHDEHAPLQLSKRDYRKWDYETGDNVVIIGGKSNNSIIFSVNTWQATIVGHALTGEDGSRQAAFDYLQEEGFDIGSAGRSRSKDLTKNLARRRKTCQSTTGSVSGELRIYPARDNPQTDAEKYQRIAEQEGIGRLSYPELVSVACKHLQYGWEATWIWFEDQFGSNFNPEETWNHLRSIVEKWPEYDHVEVPPKPR